MADGEHPNGVQIRHDLPLAEHMVAERDHVRAAAKCHPPDAENAGFRLHFAFTMTNRAGVALDAARGREASIPASLTTSPMTNSFMIIFHHCCVVDCSAGFSEECAAAAA
ncbi:MAG: hypothetical protein ACLUI6_09385 [Butyricicoccus sp.]